MATNLEKEHTLAIRARTTMKRLIAMLFPSRTQFVPHPETAALHARLDSTVVRLDAVLHTLQRRVSSKIERPHFAVVRNRDE